MNRIDDWPLPKKRHEAKVQKVFKVNIILSVQNHKIWDVIAAKYEWNRRKHQLIIMEIGQH